VTQRFCLTNSVTYMHRYCALLHYAADVWLIEWLVGGWVSGSVGWVVVLRWNGYMDGLPACHLVSVGGWKHPVVHWKPLPIRNFVTKLHVGAAGLVVLPSSKCICIYLHRFHQLSLAFLCGFLFGIFCCSSGPNEPGQWIRAYDCCSGQWLYILFQYVDRYGWVSCEVLSIAHARVCVCVDMQVVTVRTGMMLIMRL